MTLTMTLSPLDVLAITLVALLVVYLIKRRLDRLEASMNLGLTQTFEAVSANAAANATANRPIRLPS